MVGYVDKQVAQAQKAIGDAVAGKGLQAAIRQLQEKSQIRDSLKTLPARGAITSKRRIGKATATADRGDFNERSRAFYSTARNLRSSDGLLVLTYYNISTLVTDRATFNFLDYDPTAP